MLIIFDDFIASLTHFSSHSPHIASEGRGALLVLTDSRMFTLNTEWTFTMLSTEIGLTRMFFDLDFIWIKDAKLFRFGLHILSEVIEAMQGDIRLLD